MSESIAPVNEELARDEIYGVAMTARGLQLIAKIIATKANLTLVRVMMGSGTPEEGVYLGDLEDLVEPVSAGTVSEPIYQGSTVSMTVEYRSDMNGGLQEGFIIREFGIFARDPEAPDDGEVMILYGNLSKYPQYIAPHTSGGLDIRRYPVSITVAEGTTVILDGLPSTVMTLDDIKDYCVTTLLPQLLASSKEQINTHSKDKYAHQDIRDRISDLETELSQKLEETKTQTDQAVESAKEELSGALEDAKQELQQELAASSARGYIVFEPEDWEENELRIAQDDHGLDPASSGCVCSVRARIGRNIRELAEGDVETAGDTIVDAMKEALAANTAAEEDPKPYPPAEDGHIPFTWEQVQYLILEGDLFTADEAEQAAGEMGFGAWKERDNGVTAETTLEQLMTAAYLPALDGSDANFKKLLTLETLQGLRFRAMGNGKGYVSIDGQGYAARYDMDGTMAVTWGSVGTDTHMDLDTKELVLRANEPFAGDVTVIA